MNREEQNKISRKRILKASLKEFGEKDYSQASINNICKNNEISKGLLFHYYKNKDEIFLMCVENMFIDLSNYLKNNDKIIYSNAEENLKKYLEKRFEFFREFPFYEQIFYTASFNPPKHLIQKIQILKEILDQTNRDFLHQIIIKLDLKSDIIIDDVIDVIIGCWSYLHVKIQNVDFQQEGEKSTDLEMYIKEFVKMLNMILYGIVK